MSIEIALVEAFVINCKEGLPFFRKKMDSVPKKPKISGFDLIIKSYLDCSRAKTPILATSDSAGYDLFAAESKTILPKSVGPVPLDLRWTIQTGFYGKIFSRSGILTKNLITAEGGFIDSG